MIIISKITTSTNSETISHFQKGKLYIGKNTNRIVLCTESGDKLHGTSIHAHNDYVEADHSEGWWSTFKLFHGIIVITQD